MAHHFPSSALQPFSLPSHAQIHTVHPKQATSQLLWSLTEQGRGGGPAVLAISAASPSANTQTRTCFPVPAGSTTLPRTCWSPRLGSVPSLRHISTVWSKLHFLPFCSSRLALKPAMCGRSQTPCVPCKNALLQTVLQIVHFRAEGHSGAQLSNCCFQQKPTGCNQPDPCLT